MTMLFAIELRVAYSDEGKCEIAKRVIQQAVLQAYPTASLLADKESGDNQSQIAMYSHDHHNGHLDIPLRECTATERVKIEAGKRVTKVIFEKPPESNQRASLVSALCA
jgi:hypothetical protein